MSAKHDVCISNTAGPSVTQAAIASPAPRPSPAPGCRDADVAFTCSFCWQTSAAAAPDDGGGSKPHVLGRSARLACGRCRAALLDLAVCWVCGEVVVRGDDCVSLGWCFWHRLCYGCLFYGSKGVVRGATLDELYQAHEDDDKSKGTTGADEATGDTAMALHQIPDEPGRGKGREVGDIPLCANCLADVDLGGLDEETLAHGALKRVARGDDGLARHREEQRPKHAESGNATTRSLRAKYTSISSTAEQMPELSGDGHASETRSSRAGSVPCSDSSLDNSVIYVSMNNPLNGDVFKPGLAKPIPAWMQYSPGQLISSQKVLSDINQDIESASSPRSNITSAYIKRPPAPTSGHHDGESELNATQHVRETARAFMSDSLSQDTEAQGPSSPIHYSRRLSFVSDEPLVQPSSVLSQYVRSGRRRSWTSDGPPDKAKMKAGKSSVRLKKLLSVKNATLAPPQVTSPEQGSMWHVSPHREESGS